MEIARFANWHSGIPPWQWKGYYLCDGTYHYRVAIPFGALIGQPIKCERVGDCDAQSCKDEEWVAGRDLPDAVQETLGIFMEVPMDVILVVAGMKPSGLPSQFVPSNLLAFYQVFLPGEKVTPRKYEENHKLFDGDQVSVQETRNVGTRHQYQATITVHNANGKAVVDDPDAEDKRDFATKQHAYLVSKGFSPDAAGRIVKKAGPGQVDRALEQAVMSIRAWSRKGTPRAVQDALDCFYAGNKGRNQFGWFRMRDALKAVGLPVPSTTTARVFFGILDGAGEIIAIGLPGGLSQEA